MKKHLHYILSILLALNLLFIALPAISRASSDEDSDDNKQNSTTSASRTTEVEDENDKDEPEDEDEPEDDDDDIENATEESELNQARNTQRILERVQERLEETEEGETVRTMNESNVRAQERINKLISQMEARPGLLKFILGPDYKNAGEVRSQIVILRNQIRQLNQLRERIENEEDKKLIDDAIASLQTQADEMEIMLNDELSGFSLFGWLAKLLTSNS